MTLSAAAVEEAVLARARAVVAQVLDPEVPVLTIADLGVLRDVTLAEGFVHVTLTPTYSGCPAMEVIRADVEKALNEHGYSNVRIETVLAPPWSTDWISDEGKDKLLAYGIAPPAHLAGGGVVPLSLSVRCPRCGSPDTREVSRFGSTACKALWSCRSCLEPFDHFKVL